MTPEATAEPSPGTRNLAEVLVPEDQDHIDRRVIVAVLTGVELRDAADPGTGDPSDHGADTAASVTLDGRYRLGPLAGHHRVDAPRYIGATARAAHRAERIAALDGEIADLDAEVSRAEELLAEVEPWLAAAARAAETLPSTSTLLNTLRERDIAGGRHQQARQAVVDATAGAEAARRTANDRRQVFQNAARSRSLPATREGIGEVAAALSRFETDGAELVTAVAQAAARAEAEAERRDVRERRQRRTGGSPSWPVLTWPDPSGWRFRARGTRTRCWTRSTGWSLGCPGRTSAARLRRPASPGASRSSTTRSAAAIAPRGTCRTTSSW